MAGSSASSLNEGPTEDAIGLADIASAAQHYAKKAQLGLESQNEAAEIKLRAERMAGELLAQLERGKTGPRVIPTDGDNPSEYSMTLVGAGLSSPRAHRLQVAASLPEERFEAQEPASQALAPLDKARQMLAEVRTAEDAIGLADIASAAQHYAKKARLGLESQNEAAEIKLRAERKAGELLGQLERGKAGRPKKNTSNGGGISEYAATLDASSLNWQSAQRLQTAATLSEERFEIHVADTKAASRELTSTGVLRLAQREARRAAVRFTANQGRQPSHTCDGGRDAKRPWKIEDLVDLL